MTMDKDVKKDDFRANVEINNIESYQLVKFRFNLAESLLLVISLTIPSLLR